MRRDDCYIDRCPCTGAQFSFCNDCRKAQEENEDQIHRAVTPLQVSLAHIPSKTEK